MRIFQVVQKPQRRGAEVFAHQLSAWARGAGHEVSTAYLYGYDGNKRLPLAPGDAVLDGAERHPCERMPGVHPGLLERLRGRIAAFDPEIVQVNGSRTVKYGAAAAALAPRRRWKLVYRNIDSPVFWVRGAARRLFYRHLVMPRLDGIIGVSRQTLREVLEFYRLETPSEFIPNGVDLAALVPGDGRAGVRRELETPEDAVVALFMGNLTRQKRPDRFLRVLGRARARAPHLAGWLLGDGPDRAALERQAHELELEAAVRFLGYRERVAPVIDAADLYLNTSDSEGIPAVVVEVGYLGLPTLGPAVGGMPECVLDGETGHLTPSGDEAALIERLVQLAHDPEARRRLGRRAREWTAENFAIERVGARYVAFYRRVLEGGGAG